MKVWIQIRVRDRILLGFIRAVQASSTIALGSACRCRRTDVEAAVSDTLPMAVLLGTDVPELADLLDGEFLGTQANQQQGDKALLVTTRAKAKQQQEAEVLQQQRELESGVRPNTLDEYKDSEVVSADEESVKGTVVDLDGEEEGSWMDQFGEELFQPGHEKTKLSRREKRQKRLKYNPKEMPLGQGKTTTPHPLDISAKELKVLQSTDPTLDTGKQQVGTLQLRESDSLREMGWCTDVGKGQAEIQRTVEWISLSSHCNAGV